MSTPHFAGEIALLAPAKINLILEVVGRRPDGYHDIDSIFLPVDLCDEVRVAVARGAGPGIEISCDDPAVPTDSRNTAWRAAEELYRRCGAIPRVRIDLRKRIPSGAGLGGGSSDAAAVLRALARLEGIAERSGEVLAAAGAVGADVSFFLWCRPSRVRGAGEIIDPLPAFPSRRLAIAWPGFAVSTRSAYAELDRSLTSPKAADTMQRFLSGELNLREIHNDFEAIVGRSHPQIAELKTRFLSLGAEGAGLSGSGSAVFGIFRSRAEAEAAAGSIREQGFWAVSASTLNGMP
ncbi:MAG: 4-(cytidine 5'-diphospho)-2-C-methyl-D-erythritol kinase [Candidatus Binatia bacterium]